MTTSNLKKLWKRIYHEVDLLPSYNVGRSFHKSASRRKSLWANSIGIAGDNGAAFSEKLEAYKDLHRGCSARWLYRMCESPSRKAKFMVNKHLSTCFLFLPRSFPVI